MIISKEQAQVMISENKDRTSFFSGLFDYEEMAKMFLNDGYSPACAEVLIGSLVLAGAEIEE